MSDETPALNIVIIGASGAIGRSFVSHFATFDKRSTIYAFSRSLRQFAFPNVKTCSIDLLKEETIKYAAGLAAEAAPIDVVILATGLLHHGDMMPEKSLSSLSSENLQTVFAINTFAPAMVAKYFLPKLSKDRRSIFAALSARVGSISDNHLGGWYSYRASKAALNMILKTASIELARKNKTAIVVGLHPGTVVSDLSEPFQRNVKSDKLFSSDYSVSKLVEVLDKLTPQDTGKVFAWDGEEIAF